MSLLNDLQKVLILLENNQFYHTPEVSKIYETFLQKIPKAEIIEMQRKYEDEGQDAYVEVKFFDYEKYLLQAVQRAVMLNMHQDSKKVVLDIGTGAGYFPYVCQELGNDVSTFDLDTSPIYNFLTKVLGVKRKKCLIQPQKTLPSSSRQFDIITAFDASFDRIVDNQHTENHSNTQLWNIQDWSFFLHDVLKHQLAPEGLLWLLLNERSGKTYETLLPAFVEKLGGIMIGLHILIPNHVK